MTTQTIQNPGVIHIQSILNISKEVRFNANEYIFNEGKEDYNFYIVLDGEVEIIKKTSDGNAKVIAHLKAGEILGEGVLSGITIKPASAKALTDVTLIALPKNSFDELIKTDSESGVDFLLSVIGSVNNKLSRTNEKLLTLYEVNKLIGLYHDDLNSLSSSLIEKLISITSSHEGILCLKNQYSESYRTLYSTSADITENTFVDLDKDQSKIVEQKGHQYLFINLMDRGFMAFRRNEGEALFEDDQLRLLILVAEQVGNAIKAASRHASEKAKDILHQKKVVL